MSELVWIGAMLLVAFLATLAFGAFVVVRTNATSGLRDVATLVRAFRDIFTGPPR